MDLSPVNWKRKFLIYIGATVLFAAIGPFDTFSDLSLAGRLLFWAVVLFCCGLLMHLSIDIAMQLRALSALPRIARLAVGSVVAAFPCTLVVHLINNVQRQADPGSFHWFETWFAITLIGMAIGYLNFMPPFVRRHEVRGFPEIDDSLVGFLKRLPPEIGKDLVSLSMQDHYVKAVTNTGTAMIHLRFSDALSELGPLPGVRVHRSHWVSARGFRKYYTEGRSAFVQTSAGQQLPVSKTYREAAEGFAERIGADRDSDRRKAGKGEPATRDAR